MTGDSMISTRGLGKKYRIRTGAGRGYRTLREDLVGMIRRGGRLPGGTADFWALREVTLDVPRGEVLGIIGRNGAGKSTLLKILSRITTPTEGEAVLRGRVASLLEVGTGFHPELTGRENIFLSGAVLGMTRREIRAKYDEITAFSGVESFLEEPVKRYSSGMKMRLAFSVAAHLEPEILLVDEVLAVGDAEFQKKCLGKMEDVSRNSGRTVLFVSHNMAAVRNLCRRVVWMDKGGIVSDGDPRLVIGKYLEKVGELSSISLADRPDRVGSGDVRFQTVVFQNAAGENVSMFNSGEEARLVLNFENRTGGDLRNLDVAVGLDSPEGERICFLSADMKNQVFANVPSRVRRVEVRIPRLPLGGGRYSFSLFSSHNGAIADWIQNAGVFDVEGGDFYGTGKLPPDSQGRFLMDHDFRLGDL